MAQILHLGSLVSSAQGLGPSPPAYLSRYSSSGGNVRSVSNDEIAKKSVEDTNQTQSIWFVNIPSADAATAGSKKLKKYMQQVVDYRCWASRIWWKNVYESTLIDQGSSKLAVAARSAYAAKLGLQHMRLTPWLAQSLDHSVEKNIKCKTTEFHTELVKAVLLGFVDISSGILSALEAILTSLAKTIEQSTSETDTKTIIFERYEYIKEVDDIRSYIRVVNFTVSEDMKHVENAKKTESIVTCSISYNEYEALFNSKKWHQAEDDIDQADKDATHDFVNDTTIDCPP